MNTRTIVVADFVLFATTFLSKSSIYARHRAASPPRITLHLRRSLVNARTTRMLSTNFLRVRLRCRGVFSNPCIPLRSRRNGLRGMKNPQPNGREILLPRCHSSFFRKGGRLLRLCPGECRHDASVALPTFCGFKSISLCCRGVFFVASSHPSAPGYNSRLGLLFHYGFALAFMAGTFFAAQFWSVNPDRVFLWRWNF